MRTQIDPQRAGAANGQTVKKLKIMVKPGQSGEGKESREGAQTLRAFSLLELRKDKFEVEILAFQVRVQLDNLLLSDRQQCFDHLLQLRYAVTLFPRLGNEE